MGGRRFVLVRFAAVTMLPAALVSGSVFAQPSDPKDPGGEIEIDPAKDSKDPRDPKDPKIAKKWLATAQQLVQKGSAFAARNRLDEAKAQFESAVSAYQQAIEASDDVNIYADLASVEDRLGKVDEAVRHLRRVVNAKTGVRPDVAKKAAAKLEDLSTKVGLVTLTVTPAGSSITLGGVELGTSPLPESLVLMPGTYTLSFQAEGFQPMEAEINIEPGSETERAIELEPVKLIVQPVKPAEPEGSDEAHDKLRSRLPLYVGAGVTGAGVVGASIFGILAVKQHSRFTAASTPKLAREDARTAGQRYAFITDLSLGATVVAAGFTAYWYFAKYKQRQKKPEDQRPSGSASTRHESPPAGNDFASHLTKLDMIPWVQSQSGGIMIAGWF